MLKNKFISNSAWMIFGKIAQMVCTLIIGMISARYLGPDNYGLINYGASYTALFTPIISLGLTGIIVNEFVNNPNQDGKILGSAIGLRIASSFFSSGCILLIVWSINPGDKVLFIVTALQCVSLIFQWSELFNYWCQSWYNSKVAVCIQIAAYLLTSVYKIYLLATQKSVLWFAFSMGLDFILQAIGYVWYFSKKGNSALSFSWKTAEALLSQSYHYIFSALASVIYSQIDRIMLGALLNNTAVGLYTAAYTLSNVWTFVLSAIIDSARPLIVQTRQVSTERYKERVVQLYSIIIYLSVGVSVLMTLFGRLGLLIMYGREYLSASSTVGILTWGTIFSFLGVARNIWCVCENHQKYEKYLSVIGAAVNIILNAVLIPFLGISGAAIATLVTQITTNFVVAFFIKEMRENSIFIVRALHPKVLFNKQFLSLLSKKRENHD